MNHILMNKIAGKVNWERGAIEGYVLDTQKYVLLKRKYSGGRVECWLHNTNLSVRAGVTD